MNDTIRQAQAEAARLHPNKNMLESQCVGYLDPSGASAPGFSLIGHVNLAIEFPLDMPNGGEFARMQQLLLGVGLAAPYVQDPMALPAISYIPTLAGNNRGTPRGERTDRGAIEILARHASNPLNLSPECRVRVPVLQGLDDLVYSHCPNFQDYCSALVAGLFPGAANWQPYVDAIDVIELPGGRGNPALAGQAYRKPDGSVWVTPTGAEWRNVRPALPDSRTNAQAPSVVDAAPDLAAQVAKIGVALGFARKQVEDATAAMGIAEAQVRRLNAIVAESKHLTDPKSTHKTAGAKE